MTIEIALNRLSHTYYSHETVSGVIIVTCNSDISHNGMFMNIIGEVNLEYNDENTSFIESLYEMQKPIFLINCCNNILKPGRLDKGVHEFPFEFNLDSIKNQKLYETYRGILINVEYFIQVQLKKNLLGKDILSNKQFHIETLTYNSPPVNEFPFIITSEDFNLSKMQKYIKIPILKVSGKLDSLVNNITEPFTGTIKVVECDIAIKSIEVQLIRVETCKSHTGSPIVNRSEIQNIQIVDGDVARNIDIPIYMTFPKLFTCPSVSADRFKIKFEINIIIYFENKLFVVKKFPLTIIRNKK